LSVAFSPNGRFLVSGSWGSIQFLEVSTGQSIATLVGHPSWVVSVSFFPDGKRLMSASDDNTVRIWDIESLLEEVRGDMDDWVSEHSNSGAWILGPKRERLFWAPEWRPFRHPRNTLIIGRQFSELDFSQLVHGDEWEKCREPLSYRETRETDCAEEVEAQR